jgi:hypothetical protein
VQWHPETIISQLLLPLKYVVELKNVCCRSLCELRRELRKAEDRLRHKKHVIFGRIRQPNLQHVAAKVNR